MSKAKGKKDGLLELDNLLLILTNNPQLFGRIYQENESNIVNDYAVIIS